MSSGGSGVKAGRAFVLFEVLDKTAKGMKAIAGRIDRMSQRIGQIGRQLTFLGAAMAVPFTIAINSAKDLTDELLKLKAVLQADVTTMVRLEKRIRGLGKTTSFTSIQVAEAATALGRGGFSSQEIEDSLENVLNLARTGSLEMSRAATIMVDSIRNFGLSAKDSEQVADSFFVAATKGTVTVEELAQALKFSGGSGAELGISLNEMLAVLSQLSKAMLKSTIGGTSFNQMLLAVGKNANKLEEIGIEPFTDTGQLKEPLKLFRELALALKSMTPAERLPVMADIFNVRGMRAAGAMARMMDSIDEAFLAIETGATRAAKASKIMDSGIGGSIRRLISATTDLQESIGIAFTESFQRLEKAVIPVINRLSDWAAENKELFIQVAKIVVGITTLGVALITISGALAIVGGIIAGVSTLFATLSGTGGIVALAFIGAAANITAMGVILFQTWDKIKAKTLGLVNFIKAEFKDIRTSLMDLFTNLAELIAGIDFLDIISQIVDVIIPAIRLQISILSPVIQILATTNQAWIEMAKFIQNVDQATGGWFKTLRKGLGVFALILLALEAINKATAIQEKEVRLRAPQNAANAGIRSIKGIIDEIIRARKEREKADKKVKETEDFKKGITPGQLKEAEERRLRVVGLKEERVGIKQKFAFERLKRRQSKKEQNLDIERTRTNIIKDLKEQASLQIRMNREVDIDKKHRLKLELDDLNERLNIQREDEKNAIRRSNIAKAEDKIKRNKEEDRVRAIEKEIKDLGGILFLPEELIEVPRAKPGVAETTKLDPTLKGKAEKELDRLADLSEKEKRLEERRELISSGAARPNIQAFTANTMAGLQQAFGNQEAQTQSMLLKNIKDVLKEINRKEAESIRILRELGIPVGEV